MKLRETRCSTSSTKQKLAEDCKKRTVAALQGAILKYCCGVIVVTAFSCQGHEFSHPSAVKLLSVQVWSRNRLTGVSLGQTKATETDADSIIHNILASKCDSTITSHRVAWKCIRTFKSTRRHTGI